MKINWLKYKTAYFLASGLLIAVSIFAIVQYGFNLGIDFLGGSLLEYYFENKISTEQTSAILNEHEIEVGSIVEIGDHNYLFRLGEISAEKRDEIKESLKNSAQGEVIEVRFEQVGPSIGPELIRKTIYAITISAGAILLWIALQFKNLRYGLAAILAMFHDSFILIGLYTILGHYYGASLDFLFVTALLTTLSFSVHDTIVVFDRIREIKRKHGGEFEQVANRALSETMRRSINNSITIALMLIALIVFGGSTTVWFAAALLIGTILGTYSSPFVAVPLLSLFNKLKVRS